MYGSSGGGNQTSTTKVTYSPQEQQARDRIALGAEQAFASGQDWKPYAGAQPIPASANTQASWNRMNDATGKINNANNQTQQANSWAMTSAPFASSNPYLQDAMMAATRPMMQQFAGAGGPMSSIRGGAVANNTVGGSRQGIAEGIAMRGLQNKVGDMRATMSSDAYSQGLESQEAAIKNQAMLNMMHQMPAELQGKIGAQYEGYKQNEENYNAAARNWDRNYQWEPLQNFANIVYGGSNGTTSTTQSMPKTDNTGQIVGALGTAAMMAMMMSSDVRLKSGIRKIGEHAKGFGIYLYKIFNQWQVGVLAQEVRKILPEAVSVDANGYYVVDYGRLG